ncbi:YncE family protein [Pseudomonas chlororaphis]|nr:YncE family protein [Pseudomonas chlororaphis]
MTKKIESQVPVIDRGYEVIQLPARALPRGIALSPDGDWACVCNFGLDSVSLIDTRQQVVVANIPVGANPYHVAFDADKNRCYVTCLNEFAIFVIDTVNHQVVKEIAVEVPPRRVTVDSINRRVYVVCPNSHLGNAQIIVLDADEERIIDTIEFESGSLDNALTVDPVKQRAYIPVSYGPYDAVIGVIDTRSHKVIQLSPYIPGSPNSSALSPDGALLYVPAGRIVETSVVDTNTGSIRPIFATGQYIHLSPRGDRAYYLRSYSEVTEQWSMLQTVDTSTGTILGNVIIAPDYGFAMTLSSDGKYAYITCYGRPPDYSGPVRGSRVIVVDVTGI